MDRFPFFIVGILCFCTVISTSAERVEYLPGFQGALPFYLETGYVGVGENEDVQLFYYFIKSESNPKDDPLMLWLTGGPGCSSLSGLLYEIGPLEFEAKHYDGSLPTLFLRPTSWTKMASIIFLDIPVGTGFSYARTARANRSNSIQYVDHAYEFTRKWLNSHPEFISNPFYVGGSSYSGIPVPMVTLLISKGNEAGIEPYINLKGYVLGNPRTFAYEDNFRIRFSNGMGLISDEHYKSLFHNCRGEYRPEYISSDNIACVQDLELYNQCVAGLDRHQILLPVCVHSTFPIKLPSEKRSKEHQLLAGFNCEAEAHRISEHWVNDDSVREALYIRKGSVEHWTRCNKSITFTKTLDDVRAYHLNLSKKGYRSLIFSGDHDMVVPHQSTQAWIKDLRYSVTDQWRSWRFRGQIAGYTESYSNMMTFATVKGGGHNSAESNPEESFALFKRWISYQPL